MKLERWEQWAIVFTVLIAIVLNFKLTTPLEYDDYGQYLGHAKALLSGRAYGDIGYLYTPFRPFTGPPLAPPGLPIILVPFLAVTGAGTLWIRLLSIAFLLAAMVCAGRSLAREYPSMAPWAGLLALTAIVLNDGIRFLGNDLGFIALVWAAILVADRPGSWVAGRAGLVTLLAVAAVGFRLVGVAMVPALLAFTVVAHRRARWWPLLPAAGVLLVFWWQYHVAGIGTFPPAPPEVLAESGPDGDFLSQLPGRLVYYRVALFISYLYPFPWNLLNDGYHLLAAGIGLSGLAWWCWTGRRSLAVLFVGSYGALLLWLGVTSLRYAWPIFPALAIGLVIGIERVWQALARNEWWTARATGVTVVLLCLMAAASHTFKGDARVTREHPALLQVERVVDSLAEEGPVRVAVAGPRVFTWRTGAPATPLFRARPEQVLAELQRLRITHVVVGDLGLNPDLTSFWLSLVDSLPARFHLVTANEHFRILAVDQSGNTGL